MITASASRHDKSMSTIPTTTRSDCRHSGCLRGALVLFAAMVLAVCGRCYGGGTFFDSRPTELESRNTLRELEAIRETPDVQIPRPGFYSDPPQIVIGTINGVPEAKLYYFARYQRVEMLMSLFNDQYVKTLYDNTGQPMPEVPYTADMNPATHQFIVSCPSAEYAGQVLDFLVQVDVQPIQVKIDCIISEIYADHTLDWETKLAVQNLLGMDINLAGKLPGAALRDLARSNFGMKTGYVQGGRYDSSNDRFVVDNQGHMFGALIDMLASRGFLKILMNPSLEVVAGQTASIRAEENVTIDQIIISDESGVRLSPRRERIVDSLEITPHVFADGMIGLKTVAVIGSKATPEGVKQVPIKTERRITIDENRVRRGESLVIGGIRKAEQRSVVRGVPGLKDIPVLGVLFSSKDFEERAKEVMFIITPTLSTGGVPSKDIIADLKRRHDPVKQSDIVENPKDPFGSGAYTELVEQEAIQAEVGRVRAQMEIAAARQKTEELTKKITVAKDSAEGQQKRAERVAQGADAEAAAAGAAVAAAQEKTTKSQGKTEEIRQELEDHKAAAEAAAQQLQQAQQAAQKAVEEAAAAKAAAQKAAEEAEAAKAAADKVKKEARTKVTDGPKKRL